LVRKLWAVSDIGGHLYDGTVWIEHRQGALMAGDQHTVLGHDEIGLDIIRSLLDSDK
jgi:hypothetical protein